MAARLHSFLFLAVLLLLHGTSSARVQVAGDVAAAGSGKVRVALYYESLCPASAAFVVNGLAKIYKDGLLDAADVALVPYGNAKVAANGAISCQVLCHRLAARPIRYSVLLSYCIILPFATVDVSLLSWGLEFIADAVNFRGVNIQFGGAY